VTSAVVAGRPWVRVALLAACSVTAFAPARAVRAQAVAIEVTEAAFANGTYLCWTPVKARARITGGLGLPGSPGPPIPVMLTSESDDGAGVQFQADGGARPDRNSFAPGPRLDLQLPPDGSWTPFWVAGARPSRAANDVRIVAKDGNGSLLGSLPVMVRVRKNAENLTDAEIQLLVDALVRLHDVENFSANSLYTPLVRIHEDGNMLGIHDSPLFLAWHRALLLDLERRLQAINGPVTIPYWRFDRKAPRVFSPDFMGVIQQDDIVIGFSEGNRLAGWSDPKLGGLLRSPHLSPAAKAFMPEDYYKSFMNTYTFFNDQVSNGYHKAVHRGINGWLGLPYSPADPLFFLLHANVDRAWAHWQASNDRFDAVQMESYSRQGSYPGQAPFTDDPPGTYAEDGMWPWNPTQPPSGTAPHWPAIVHPMPQNGPTPVPQTVTPASQIDYLDVQGKGLALGYCYDDIDFRGQELPSMP
jgi:tyrosinase